MRPLVSVICVCYNHERFVLEALESVKAQTYPHVELIVVDDGSSDNSAKIIGQWLNKNPPVQFLNLKINQGYCMAFNKAFAKAKGEFIIDLAADDVLLPDRIEKGIEGFILRGEKYGVQFGDAAYMDIEGKITGKHSDRFPHRTTPEGDVYRDIIQRYFVCSASMMVRKSVLDQMGGYDKALYYEDFDLWIRASRNHWFFYVPEILVRKRIVPGSLGDKQYSRQENQMLSTYLVCLKVFRLNRTKEEKKALNKRIFYEMKWSLRFLHLGLTIKYLFLLVRNRF